MWHVRPARVSRSRAPKRRLLLEQLDVRDLPSTFVVDRLNDMNHVGNGIGSGLTGDLRYAVGPGVRYATPIGPARLDVGYQLNPLDNLLVNGEPQKRRWRIHFSIGQAY